MRVEEGLLHDTFSVRCNGAEYVLQFGSDDEDDRQDSLGRGLGCYRLLADAGIPVPDPVTDGVRTFDGRRYALVEKRPGTSAERDVSPARARVAGR